MRVVLIPGALLLAVAAVAACSSDSSGTANGNQPDASGGTSGGPDGAAGVDGSVNDAGPVALCDAGLQSLELSPAQSTLQLDGSAAPPTLSYAVIGHFADGHSASIAGSDLTWVATRADDANPGQVAGGVFTPYPLAGGTVTIMASASGEGGVCAKQTATVNLFLSTTIGTPTSQSDWAGTPVSTNAPTIVYPNKETRFPRNLYRTLFQWRTAGFSEFRLQLTGPGSSVTIYTKGVHDLCLNKLPAAGCWEADETAWSFIGSSNAGKTVAWTVDALDRSTVPPTIRRAGPITIGFSRKDIATGVLYWSTTAAGVRRASLKGGVAGDYLGARTTYTSPLSSEVRCVGCHTVSRDGKYMVAPVDATSGQSLWALQVTDQAPPSPLVTSFSGTTGRAYATISPDDARVVVSIAGSMQLFDRATGSALGALPSTAVGTQPDWSPSGDRVAYATGSGDAPMGASIATIAYANGTWGAETVVATSGGPSNLFPRFSNDGNWIAYARGMGGHDDMTAQLWLVEKDGTNPPIELTAANRMVDNALTLGQHENSEPTWATDGDYLWIAFNSERPFGVVRPAGRQQIWVAAIDPAVLSARTGDPSFPAFRLPHQALDEDNHRAFFLPDVVVPAASPLPLTDGGACLASATPCSPGVDTCCNTADVCDTSDNGATYACMTRPVPP